MEPQPRDPDVDRMLAFCAGDAGAFDQLFERWAGPLLRYLERLVGDAATAEELVQESFLRVHGARERYEPRARFSTFLYRIATNLALNELKRPRRARDHESADVLGLASSSPAPDHLTDDRRAHAALVRALDELPERQRIALWMTAAEGCSQREVAELLGASEKSVKALVHRARASLAGRMAAAGAIGGRGPGGDGRSMASVSASALASASAETDASIGAGDRARTAAREVGEEGDEEVGA
jgi:RNA polymerase sigma-70 factor (ECF subfamily)